MFTPQADMQRTKISYETKPSLLYASNESKKLLRPIAPQILEYDLDRRGKFPMLLIGD